MTEVKNVVFSGMFSLISWNEFTNGIGERVLVGDGKFLDQQNLLSFSLCSIICSWTAWNALSLKLWQNENQI